MTDHSMHPDARGPAVSEGGHAPGLDAVIEQDADGMITGWNARAERLFGWPASDVIGKHSRVIVPSRNYDRHERGLRDLAADPDGQTRIRTITALHSDGHEFAVELVMTVRYRDGKKSVRALARQIVSLTSREAPSGADSNRFRAILDQIEDGCCVVDLRGTYLFANDAFCRMFGYEKERILGQNFTATASPGRSAQIREIYAEVYRTGRPNRGFEYQITASDGSPRFVEQSISLEREAGGRAIGFLGISRDCTARRLAEQDAASAKEVAESANRAKSEFLANMSHEIRTPMNGIIGMTELALGTGLTPYQHDCMTTVKTSAESLLTILNEILDFSKIESRKLALESVSFTLAEVINDTIRPLAVRADQKGLEIISDIAPDVPAGLVGDPTRLKQVLTNLLGNALKFTERGHVLLTVRAVERQGPSTRLCFSVTDTGIGIPADKHAAIFEPFRQADGSTTRRFGGTGLGLAIASNLVHLMGGELSLASEPGSGSTFYFTAAFETVDVPAAPRRVSRLEDVRVLIVDDNAVNRRIFEDQSTHWRMKPTCVDGGQAALEALATATREGRPYGLVLLDANMPDLDGFGVAEEIAKRPELAGATIMMLTSSGQYGDVARCRNLGIASYLTKPIRQADLHEAICRILGNESVATPTAVAAVAPQGPARSVKVLLAEDNVVNQRVADGLLTKRGHRVTVVGNGHEALSALDRETFDLVLMDVQMPELGGFEATAAIRERERGTGQHVRIVAMTAHAMTGDRERCLAAGMDGYLSKPIDARRLFAVVEEEAAVRVCS